jgi:hypothetical protein
MDPRLYDATAIASGLLPGAGLMDVIGQAPAIGGGMGPNLWQNLRNKQYVDAMLQMAGAAGDALMIIPPVGMTVKAATTAGKTARAGSKTADALTAAKKAAAAPTTTARQGASMSKQRVGTTGKYVGAPTSIDSPQKLAAMRQNYMQQVEAGIPGRDWYQDSSKWIQSVTNPGGETALARTLGVSSQGTGVDTNLGFAVKGVNQFAAGLPVQTGRFPGDQSPLIEGSLQGSTAFLGPKRQPFASNLAVEWDPKLAQHPVHDIWQGRAFGYTTPSGKPWDAGFSPQQHAFMDQQTQAINKTLNTKQVGGFSDWDPLRTQAAAWTGAKIKAGDLMPSDAAMHYGDFSPKYQASATYEQTPGVGTGHLEGLANMPFDQRAQYSSAAPWTDVRGRDTIYGDAGMLVEPTRTSVGAYTPAGTGLLEINPAEVARPLVQTSGGNVIPSDAGLLNVGESARAYMDVQNAGAWHKVIPNTQTAVGDRNSLSIPMSGSPSEDQMRKISELATANGMFAVDTGKGISLINDQYSTIGAGRTGTSLGKELQGDLGEKLQKVVGSRGERVKIEGGYQDYESLWRAGQGSSKATQKFIDDMASNPKFAESIEPALRQKAAANLKRDADFSAQTGTKVRQDVQEARKIFSEKGLAGLKKALKGGAVLPAAAAVVLAPEMMESDGQEPQADSLMGML